MKSIIQINNLGKKYRISHEQNEQYTALRDVITNKTNKLFSFPYSKHVPTPKPLMYEDFWALKDISFEVQPGDRVGIIGRNGAGKSTLLKILSRITEPSTGRIELHGRVASLLEVGTGFHPELTGRENIFLNGAILGMSRTEIRSKFEEIVDFSGVSKFLDTPIKRYSSGMYVRLAFAVAAHLEPEILVVDEVLAVGDAEFQKKAIGKMQEVSSIEGRTVLFVSHNIGIIRTLCSKTVLLADGQMKAYDSTEKVINKYVESNSTSDVYYASKTNGECYIQKAALKNRNNEYKNTFDFSENIVLEVAIVLNNAIRSLSFGFGFINKFNTRAFSFTTNLPNQIGSYQIEIILPKEIIAPGVYSFDLGIDIPNQTLFDYISNILQVEILKAADGQNIVYNTHIGDFILHPEYKLLQLPHTKK